MTGVALAAPWLTAPTLPDVLSFVPMFVLSTGPCGLKPFYVLFIGSNIRGRLGHPWSKGRFLEKKVKILLGFRTPYGPSGCNDGGGFCQRITRKDAKQTVIG
jgi:hypothetical protein